MPTKPDIDLDVIEFFALFQRASADTDVETLASCFLDSFLVGDAHDARTVPRDAFLQALAGRSAAATAAGIGPAALTALSVDALDPHWFLARTQWSAPRAGAADLVMSSTFLLRRHDGALRVATYLNHEGLGLRGDATPNAAKPRTDGAGNHPQQAGHDLPPAVA